MQTTMKYHTLCRSSSKEIKKFWEGTCGIVEREGKDEEKVGGGSGYGTSRVDQVRLTKVQK